MFYNPVVLDLTSTNHYCIEIADKERKQNRRSKSRAEAPSVHETTIETEALRQS